MVLSKLDSKAELVFDISNVRGHQRKEINSSLHPLVIISKAVSSVGTEPLRHSQFPVEGHSNVLIYLTDSSFFALCFIMLLTVGWHFFFLRRICQSFPFAPSLSALCSSQSLADRRRLIYSSAPFVSVHWQLVVRPPLTACREQGMKEGHMERKRGCCCRLFSLSAL